jgi:hypothetical protein
LLFWLGGVGGAGCDSLSVFCSEFFQRVVFAAEMAVAAARGFLGDAGGMAALIASLVILLLWVAWYVRRRNEYLAITIRTRALSARDGLAAELHVQPARGARLHLLQVAAHHPCGRQNTVHARTYGLLR